MLLSSDKNISVLQVCQALMPTQNVTDPVFFFFFFEFLLTWGKRFTVRVEPCMYYKIHAFDILIYYLNAGKGDVVIAPVEEL